jgi:hypothetical protein
MFDFWRNLTKSKAEKERELLHAYVDNALSPVERTAFEARLAQDANLQAEVEALQQVKQMLAAVPRRRVPRNFTLDPARYGRPAPQPLLQAQPVLRLATVLTAVIFIVVLALDWSSPGMPQSASFEAVPVEEIAVMERSVVVEDTAETEEVFSIMEEIEPAAEPPSEVEITRVVTETVMTETVTEIIEEPAPSVVDGDETVTEAEAPPATPTTTPGVANDVETAVTATIDSPQTVIIAPTPMPEPRPILTADRQWLRWGLGSLLGLLLLLLFLARRQASV